MGRQRTAGPGEINHAFFDPYSLVHGLVGVFAAVVLRFGFLATLALAVGWEVVEHLLKNIVPGIFPHPTQDTFANSAGDVIATMLGWLLVRVVRATRSGFPIPREQ
jgi:hypothetical protein